MTLSGRGYKAGSERPVWAQVSRRRNPKGRPGRLGVPGPGVSGESGIYLTASVEAPPCFKLGGCMSVSHWTCTSVYVSAPSLQTHPPAWGPQEKTGVGEHTWPGSAGFSSHEFCRASEEIFLGIPCLLPRTSGPAPAFACVSALPHPLPPSQLPWVCCKSGSTACFEINVFSD